MADAVVDFRTAPPQRLLLSEPEIADAPTVGWKITERIQSIEVIDRQMRDRVRWGEPQVDRHAPPPVLLKPQTTPAQHVPAGWAEVDLERRIGFSGPGIGVRRT